MFVLMMNGHVACLKTATGVGNKVDEKHVALIAPMLKKSRLKAGGGISTLSQTKKLFELGANKIGSSKGFEILAEAKQELELSSELK